MADAFAHTFGAGEAAGGRRFEPFGLAEYLREAARTVMRCHAAAEAYGVPDPRVDELLRRVADRTGLPVAQVWACLRAIAL